MLWSSSSATSGLSAVALMKGLPFIFFGVQADAVEFPEPISSVGRGEEERAAAGGGEHGSDDVLPEGGAHVGGFVEHGEVDAVAAEVIGIVGAADGDHAAAGQVNPFFSFAYGDAF